MTISRKSVDNALNPAWREAAVHFITSQSWDDTVSEEAANQAIEDMTFRRGYALRQLAPDSGAYFNEVRSMYLHLPSDIFFFLLACFHSLTAKRLTSTSPTGSGLCLGTITPVFTQLNKSMILIICSGAIIVLAAKLGLLKITAPCVGPSNVFDPECVGGKSWMMVCLISALLICIIQWIIIPTHTLLLLLEPPDRIYKSPLSILTQSILIRKFSTRTCICKPRRK